MSEEQSAHAGREVLQPLRIGLLGRGISGSRTPRMHMWAARALSIPYDYVLVDAQERLLPDRAEDILDLLQAEGFDGLNVTYPYKRAVAEVLEDLSDAARDIGAVNTVVMRGDRRIGDNTDHWGFLESLRLGLPGAALDRVLMLGAGGAGRAVSHALLDAGAKVLMIRDLNTDGAVELARLLCDRYGDGRAVVVASAEEEADRASGIVNCTPMGMEKLPGMAIRAGALRPSHWVADIVYFPLETELLAHARRLGCAVLPGAGMALYQAVRAFELFTGQVPDIERMREAFDSFS